MNKNINLDILNKIPKDREENNRMISDNIIKSFKATGKMVVRKNLSSGAVFVRLMKVFDGAKVIDIIAKCEKYHQYNPDDGGFVIFQSWADDSWTIIADEKKYPDLVEPVCDHEVIDGTRQLIEKHRKIMEGLSLTDDEIDVIMINKKKASNRLIDSSYESALYKLTLFFISKIDR